MALDISETWEERTKEIMGWKMKRRKKGKEGGNVCNRKFIEKQCCISANPTIDFIIMTPKCDSR
jgi:hypothetical protein